jgi:flagellar assembly protein FliH
LQAVEELMKSFSRIHAPSVQKQLEAWAPSELDVEFAVPPVEIQKEQILAIFRHEEETTVKEKEVPAIFRSQKSSVSVTVWEPEEIDLRPPLPEVKAWDFVEAPAAAEEEIIQETWQEQVSREKEAEAILQQARIQAEEIILEARATADKVILQAQDEIDSEKREGYQQGWNEARNELGETLRAVHGVVEEICQWRDVLTSQGEQILVEMLKEIAQTMFGEGVRLDPNALQINLNRVMEHAQKLGDLNIFLNRRDAELLDPSWSEYQLLITGNRVKIIPSEKITPGGCLVKGSMGMIDGRVETQLAALMNTIEEIREAKE